MNKQEKESKSVLPRPQYSEAFKRSVVSEYERGILNKDQVQVKYGIGGNSVILNWCRKYGRLAYSEKGTAIGRPMKDPQKQQYDEDGGKFSGENYFLQFMGGGDGIKKRRYAENLLYSEGLYLHLDVVNDTKTKAVAEKVVDKAMTPTSADNDDKTKKEE